MMWLWLLFAGWFSSFAAADAIGDMQERLPVGGTFSAQSSSFCAADGDIEYGVKHAAVVEHSFTDQFLEFLRQREQAIEAANQNSR